MKHNPLARNYDGLTPEERFRLILAASGRGDDAGRGRLVNSAARRTYAERDFAPYAIAIDVITPLIYLEFLEAAAFCEEAWLRADAGDLYGEAEAADLADDEARPADGGPAPTAAGEGGSRKGRGQKPAAERLLDLALAAGYLLRTKAAGWKRFCERLHVPPCLLWEILPGYDRLRRALATADQLAFTPAGFLRWLNATRREGEPERAEVPLTVDRAADDAEKLFRARVAWWGG